MDVSDQLQDLAALPPRWKRTWRFRRKIIWNSLVN